MTLSNGYPVMNYVHIQRATALTIPRIPGARVPNARVFSNVLRGKGSKILDRLFDNIKSGIPTSVEPVLTDPAGNGTETNKIHLHANDDLKSGILPAEATLFIPRTNSGDNNVKPASVHARKVSTVSALPVTAASSLHTPVRQQAAIDDAPSLDLTESPSAIQFLSSQDLHNQPGHTCNTCNWVCANDYTISVGKSTPSPHAGASKYIRNERVLGQLYAMHKKLNYREAEIKRKNKELQLKQMEIDIKDRQLAMYEEKLQDAGMAVSHMGKLNARKAGEIAKLKEQIAKSNLPAASDKHLSVGFTPSPSNRRASTIFPNTPGTSKIREFKLQGGKRLADGKNEKETVVDSTTEKETA